MAIDKKHAIGPAGGVRADNDHECYDYFKDDVPQAAEGGHASDSPWPSAKNMRSAVPAASGRTASTECYYYEDDVGLEPYEHDFVLL
jgi:hypothetical protein